LSLELHFRPWVTDNELYWADFPVDFWYYEGASDVSGTINGVPVKGTGFTEGVGYGFTM
jgi:hypothetical protein